MLRSLAVGVGLLLVAIATEGQEKVLAIYKGVPAYTKRQCVEYVRRYLLAVTHYELPGLGSGEAGSAKYVFGRVKKGMIKGLVAYDNGGFVPPKPDDVLCFTHATAAGHVAIVTKVTPTEVHIIEQNWSKTGTAVLTYSRDKGIYMVTRAPGSYVVQGWCRVPSHRPAEESGVVLLLDRSWSVMRTGAAEEVVKALRAWNRRQQVHQRWLAITFAKNATLLVSDRLEPLSEAELAQAEASIDFRGKTNLSEAFGLALRETRSWARTRIILISDGRQTEGDAERVLEAVVSRNVSVFTVGIGPRPNAAFLRKIAEQTGGTYADTSALTIDSVIRTMLP